METLKPQFTPGQVLASPGANLNNSILSPHSAGQFIGQAGMGGSGGGAGDIGERLNHLQLQQEIDSLKAQNRDLTEKLDTLKGFCSIMIHVIVYYVSSFSFCIQNI